MRKILDGIRVIDFGHWIAGPEAAAFLGDLGADVFHVEQKGVGNQLRGVKSSGGVPMELPQGRHTLFETFNRNKRGLAIDMKKPMSREVMHRLVENSDVFITNFQEESAKRFALDYATLRELNPRLVYGCATGFGDKGPDSSVPTFDILYVARCGLMMSAGHPSSNDPCFQPSGIADEMGAIMLGFGIIAALFDRERSGTGQKVRVSPLAASIGLLRMSIDPYLLTGQEMPKMPREKPVSPAYDWYKCKDGVWIVLAMHREIDWAPFCRAIGMPELAENPRFDSITKRAENGTELVEVLDNLFITRTYQQWAEVFRKAGLAFGPVNTMAGVASDPQILANGYISEYEHPVLGKIKHINAPWQFSETPPAYSRCAPEIGEHTEEILIEAGGYGWDDIQRLKEQGVI